MKKQIFTTGLIFGLSLVSTLSFAAEPDSATTLAEVQDDTTTVQTLMMSVGERKRLYQEEEQRLNDLLASPSMNLCDLHVSFICVKIEKAAAAIQEDRRLQIEDQNKQIDAQFSGTKPSEDSAASGGGVDVMASALSILASDNMQIGENLNGSIRRLTKLKSFSGRTLNLKEKLTVLGGTAHTNAAIEGETLEALRSLIN